MYFHVGDVGQSARPLWLTGEPAPLDFHHRDARAKEYGISVMLCANRHREVHAGVRELADRLLGLAEAATEYAA